MTFNYLATSPQNIAWFNNLREAGSLDLRPTFQRRPVWLPPQQSYLIDSILRGYPIPEVYIQETVDADGGQKFRVIDGQQRLRACLAFIDGDVALGDYKPLHGDEEPLFQGSYLGDLSEDIRKRFWEYKFIVRYLPDVGDAQLRLIFQRLNRNVLALNKQELRHSSYVGPFIRTMEELAELDFWGGSGVFTPNDVRRMYDVEFISELSIALLHGVQNKKQTVDKWYQTYEEDFEQAGRVRTTFSTVLGEIEQGIPDLHRTRWRQKSDFYSLFLHLAESVSHLPLSKTGRKKLALRLKKAELEVERVMLGESTTIKAAKKYALAVQRAASDLNNRRARQAALKELLPLD